MQEKELEKKLVTWLKTYKSNSWIKLTILLGILIGSLLVIQAWILASILHKIVIMQQDISYSYSYIGAFAFIVCIRALLTWLKEKISFQAGKSVRLMVRKQIISKIERMGPAFIQSKPGGSWVSMILEQVEDLHDFYARYMPQVTLAGFIPIIILVAIFPINWAAGLILLVTAPLIPIFMIIVGNSAANANRKNFRALAFLSGYFLDRLKGINTIKIFNKESSEVKKIRASSEEFKDKTMGVLKLAFLSSGVLEFFAAVSIAVVAVYFGFSYIDHLNFGAYGVKVTLFIGLFVLILAPEFYQPLRDLGSFYHAKAQAIGAAESIVKLLAQHDSFNGSLHIDDLIKIEAIDLSVLSFDNKVLVGPLSFRLNMNEKLGIVGSSGSGKTSLLYAILGFLPYTGSLKINDIELNKIDRRSWLKIISWLGQDPKLISTSIRNNVAFDGSDDLILSCLKQAQLEDFIEEKGLDYEIKDGMHGVSVGQAQRIALARCIYKVDKASLLILDEPTASLDSNTENLIVKKIKGISQNKTTILVTHRQEQLQDFDKIIVLKKGKLTAMGNYNELMQTYFTQEEEK